MMLQNLQYVIFILDEDQISDSFTEDYVNCTQPDFSLAQEQEEESEINSKQEPSKGFLGSLLNKEKEVVYEPGQEFDFLISFLFKCLKVCNEKKKMQTICCLNFLMGKLQTKRSRAELIFKKVIEQIKIGNSIEINFELLSFVNKWMQIFSLDVRKQYLCKHIPNFLKTENFNEICLYNQIYEIWISLGFEDQLVSNFQNKDFEEYLNTFQILFLTKKINSDLGQKIHSKINFLLNLVLENLDNNETDIHSKLTLKEEIKKESKTDIKSMFTDYKIEDEELSDIQFGTSSKVKKIKQDSQPIKGQSEKTEPNLMNLKINKKPNQSQIPKISNDDFLDLQINPKSNNTSNKKIQKKTKILSLNNKIPSESPDLLDFSAPSKNSNFDMFDMTQLKNDLSLFEEVKKSKEDDLMNSFFNKSKPKKEKKTDQDKLNIYFGKKTNPFNNEDDQTDFLF